MNVLVLLSASAFIYFTYHILDNAFCDVTPWAGLQRDPNKQFRYAQFIEHFYHVLDVAKIEGVEVQTGRHCLLRCVKNDRCFSANTGAFHLQNGNISCDLLPTDKYNASDKFKANHTFHHYSILSPCESFPCQHGGTCQALYETDDYRCTCKQNYTGKNCENVELVTMSCKELYKRNVTSGGGWSLVMKIDGRKQTFHYDSSFWSDQVAFNTAAAETGFDTQETKLPTYWSTPFTKICLGMRIPGEETTNFITLDQSADSLYSLIADGQFRPISVGRDTWKSLLGSQGSLQHNCNREGFNAKSDTQSFSKTRIGIIGNNGVSCQSCDSRIGFGSGGQHDDTNTCGIEAVAEPDNGDKRIKVMGYILIQ